MIRPRSRSRAILAVASVLGIAAAAFGDPVHFTYMWHNHQPIYYNDKSADPIDRYERAWDTIQAQRGGRPSPSDNVENIFSVPDRVAAYQGRPKDSVWTILGFPDAGAQLNMSGALMENVGSLAGNLSGYSGGWQNPFVTGRTTNNASGKPRLDIVNFTYHHSLAPLHTDITFDMELRLHRRKMEQEWGVSPAHSRGYWPTELAFSQRLIPTLKKNGVDWTFVSGNHISRACVDFPLILGTGGENTEPPNKADKLNPAQTNYYRQQISRGCSPANAMPLAYTPQRTQYVDPETGTVHEIIVIPCAQEFSWVDGYNPWSASGMDALLPYNNPSRPMLMTFAHDGDNAYAGGYSYYMNDVYNFVSGAGSNYKASTVETYLEDYPVPSNAVVHVEDGPWVNADSDFGSPTFVNWLYPLLDSSGQPDPVNGWHEKAREYAMFMAAENRVRTATQVSGLPIRFDELLYPSAGTNLAERAWHYYLGALDSGNVYYGTPGDMEVRSTVGINEAVNRADQLLGGSFTDLTTPTIFIPQRWPYNPGELNFGVTTGYSPKVYGPDFTVWSFVYDVSGLASVNLKWRVDNDGDNSTTTTHNETYAGGADVGPWQTLAMNGRVYPKGNIYNKGDLDYTELPQYIADHYSATITGQAGKLIDYYVEAVDNEGNMARSPIKHVWVGTQTGPGGGGGGTRVTTVPTTPTAGMPVMVQFDPAGGALAAAPAVYMHYGYNGWSPVLTPPYVPMTWNAGNSRWETTITLQNSATVLDVVFNNNSGTWDSNGGQDWHIAVQGGNPPPPPPWVIDGVAEPDDLLLAETTGGLKLWAANVGSVLYVGAPRAASGNDHFILIGSTSGTSSTAMWAKAGNMLAWDAFIGNEVTNNFAGWFNATQQQNLASITQIAAGGSGGVVEGQIDLAGLYGNEASIPATIYIAAVAYGNPDGGALVSALQVPVTVNSNGNVDPPEYLGYPFVVPVEVSAFSLD